MKIDVPNYTQLPNVVLDHQGELGEAQLRIMLAVCRKTFGWHKHRDRISLTQLEALTGLSRQGVINGIEQCMAAGWLTRFPVPQGFEYEILLNAAETPASQPGGLGVVNVVDQQSPQLVNVVDTQKKVLNKAKESSAAKPAADRFSTVEQVEMEPIVLDVPQGGNARSRAAFMGTCPECHCKVIAQTMDFCPGKNCGIPVIWTGSKIADDRYKSAEYARQDARAKQAKENAERLSETTAFVVAIARATAVTNKLDCNFIKGEEAALFSYEQAYSAEFVREKTNQFKAEGDRGRGLISHLINFFAVYNPDQAKPKGNNNIITDGDEYMRQAQEDLLRKGGG